MLNSIYHFSLGDIWGRNIEHISEIALISPCSPTQTQGILSHHPLLYGCTHHHAQHWSMNKHECQANLHYNICFYGLRDQFLSSLTTPFHFPFQAVYGYYTHMQVNPSSYYGLLDRDRGPLMNSMGHCGRQVEFDLLRMKLSLYKNWLS